MKKSIAIKEALSEKNVGKTVSIRGWVHRERGSNKFKFFVIRDVSGTIQAIVKAEDKKLFKIAEDVTRESSVIVSGKIRKDKRAPTGYELQVTDLEIVGKAETFPISRDKSEEFLLDVRHLWVRSRKLTNVFKIRSTVVGAIHEYFRKNEFIETQVPILTPTACEGGSSLFKVDYFGDTVYLTQSWQLYSEALAASLEKLYTIAPSFRAEKSRTPRHLTEYWHAEMEVIYCDLPQLMKYGEELVSYVCQEVARKNTDELKELGQDPRELKKIKAPFPKITYKEALDILAKNGMKVKYGKDLRTLEERELMKHFERPVFVTNYPKEIMAFYKPEDPENPGTALCFDLIVPEVGELIGGSVRDLDVDAMKKVLTDEGEDLSTYEWYFDTRKYGAVPHAGFGLGVERLVMWICGLEHIRDAIPFPRTINRKAP